MIACGIAFFKLPIPPIGNPKLSSKTALLSLLLRLFKLLSKTLVAPSKGFLNASPSRTD